MTICRPLVASVSSNELVVAVVVSVTLASVMLPVFFASTVRSIVSPAAMFVAATLRRLFAALTLIGASDTVPELTDCDTDSVSVNSANAPTPTTSAAATKSAAESMSLLAKLRRRVRAERAVMVGSLSRCGWLGVAVLRAVQHFVGAVAGRVVHGTGGGGRARGRGRRGLGRDRRGRDPGLVGRCNLGRRGLGRRVAGRRVGLRRRVPGRRVGLGILAAPDPAQAHTQDH